jgi:FdhD protein
MTGGGHGPAGRAARDRADFDRMRSGRDAGVVQRQVIRVSAPATTRPATPVTDEVAVEEPLEIRVAGDPLAVTMRTPGADRELALGFLHAEGVIGSLDDVGSVAHCGRPGDEGFGNTIDVLPGPGRVLAPERVEGTRRGTLTAAACGVCGRLSIDDLVARCAPLRDDTQIDAAVLARLIGLMRERQTLFERTGGVHAAALFAPPPAGAGATGQLAPPIAIGEDVGRHNAVDKVVGALLFARALPAAGRVLLVSGRASFEIVQKAAVAGIPIVASVSAPSSLAIDLAARFNLTLVAFLRGETMSVYTAPERIVVAAAA